jgi:uncharacterized protein DUF5667
MPLFSTGQPLAELAPDLAGIDPSILDRARRYERAAVESVLERCLDPVYRTSFALTGEPAQAEALSREALLKGLRGLGDFRGDQADFEAAVVREAVAAAARRRPADPGYRQSLAELGRAEYEVVALRIFAAFPTGQLSVQLGRRPALLRSQLLSALRSLAGDHGSLPPWGPDLTAFDAAVDLVVGGDPPARAAASVGEPTDVLARLRTVASLRRVPRPPITPAARDRLRQDVLATASELRVHWVQGHQGTPKVPGMEQRRYPKPTRGILTLGVVLVLAGMIGVSLAVVSSFADPDSLLYPLKRIGESTLVTLTPDPVSRSELETKLALTRQREAEDMASRGKGALAVQAVQDRVTLLQASARDLSAASRQDSRWKDARTQFMTAASSPLDDVEHDLDVTGQPPAAEQVRRIDVDWVHQQQSLRQTLGQPTPSPTPTAAPTTG